MGLSAGFSLYQYVDADPLNSYDPLGLCKECNVTARVLMGNHHHIGRSGAFNGSPSNLVKYGVTADSAIIIPSQFGLTKTQMRPIIEQISGEVMDGSKVKFRFNHVRDMVDDRDIRKANHWDLNAFQDHVIGNAQRKNGGQPTLVLELPGLSRDLGIKQVKLSIRDNVNWPDGTQ